MALLPPNPNTQALKATDFVVPPLDGSLNISQVIDFNAKHSPHHPFFRYDDPSTRFVDVSWRAIQRATYRAAQIVQSYEVRSDAGASRVIAILALVDTISYFTLILGILRAGYIPFPLSPQNSPAVIARLLGKTKTAHIFVSEDQSMLELSAEALKVLAGQGGQVVERLPTPFYDELYAARLKEDTILPARSTEMSSVALYLHTSGTTSSPEPIRMTHRIVIEWLRIPFYGEADLCNEVIGSAALLMYHGLAVVHTFGQISAGAILAVDKPVRQPPLPTPEGVIESAATLKATVLLTSPAFLQAWSRNPSYVQILKRCRAVVFSDGPLSKVVGDGLAAENVRLMQVFGIAEAGCVSVCIPKNVDPQLWEWFQFSSQHHIVLVPQEDSEAEELHLLPCATHTPAILNVRIDGKDGYHTNDLVVEHPTKPGYFKIFGRTDDQIILSTGEKTNPGPLEAIISQDRLINGAVMFGRGKAQNGVIIQPADSIRLRLDLKDRAKAALYLDLIWPSIRLANDHAPPHSQISREMVMIAVPSKPFMFTGKGSICRSAVLAEYADEIDAAYAQFEQPNSANAHNPTASTANGHDPTEWTKDSTTDLVRQIVVEMLETQIADTDDVFQHGVDSIHAMLIRNRIVNTLKEVGIDVSSMPPNLVYEASTVAKLGVAVNAGINPSSSYNADRLSHKITEIEGYVNKYTAKFPRHEELPAPSYGWVQPGAGESKDIVVLTGPTGALGTTLLAQLVELPNVSRIYALSRKSARRPLMERQVEALVDLGYDPSVASAPKVLLVETDASLGSLGLTPALYDEIRSSATTIIHTSWIVDLNLSLSTFAPYFQLLRDLVDLALTSPLTTPPRLLFASSTRIFGACSATPATEAPIEDPNIVVGMGYRESLWVAERVLDHAAVTTALRPVIVRIGQLSGGKNGYWSTAEWVPSIVRSGEVVKALPYINESISWLPLEAAGAAILDLRMAPTGTYHLAHPDPVLWKDVFGPISTALDVPVVPYAKWLDLLEADLADPSHTEIEAVVVNPALGFIDMFRPLRDRLPDTIEAREAMAVPKVQTKNVMSVSRALAPENLKPLGEKDALMWLKYWQMAGLLETKVPGEQAKGASRVGLHLRKLVAVGLVIALVVGIVIIVKKFL